MLTLIDARDLACCCVAQIQRYCDVKEKEIAHEAHPDDVMIYFVVAIYTLLLGWGGVDNAMIVGKYFIGRYIFRRNVATHQQTGDGENGAEGGELERGLLGGSE